MRNLSSNVTKLSIVVALFAGLLVWQPQAEAVPIPCIVCGSIALGAPGIEATVSFAVITGASFAAEVAGHGIGFFGLVPSGTLGPPVIPAPTDFVYLYQLVNSGPSADFISSWTISGGGVGSASGAITAGTRLESTLFVDPNVGPAALITAGPVVAPTAVGLSAGPLVNFENGLGDPNPGPVAPPWGPCLGSGGIGVNCSDGVADLLLASVHVFGWGEAPSGFLLDPLWSGSIIWFASPNAPVLGSTSILAGALFAGGSVPVPAAVPAPATLVLLGLGLAGLGFARRRRVAD